MIPSQRVLGGSRNTDIQVGDRLVDPAETGLGHPADEQRFGAGRTRSTAIRVSNRLLMLAHFNFCLGTDGVRNPQVGSQLNNPVAFLPSRFVAPRLCEEGGQFHTKDQIVRQLLNDSAVGASASAVRPRARQAAVWSCRDCTDLPGTSMVLVQILDRVFVLLRVQPDFRPQQVGNGELRSWKMAVLTASSPPEIVPFPPGCRPEPGRIPPPPSRPTLDRWS